MHQKQLRLRDFQIKKNLEWHILRLLRLNRWTQQELMAKISDMYMGYWKVNREFIEFNLKRLADKNLIEYSDYKFYVGGRTRSISLVADAYHTKTDIWSSVAVLIGLVGATMGLLILDAIAGVVVSLFIILGGYELIKESKKVMQGQDPNIEKFSKFLESHLKVLPDGGAFASL